MFPNFYLLDYFFKATVTMEMGIGGRKSACGVSVVMVIGLVVIATLCDVTLARLPGHRRNNFLRTSSRLPTDPWQLFNISVKQNGNKTEGLFPHVFNLATKAEITSNATCGVNGPEQFCKLVEHVKRRRGDRIQCGVCDDTGSDTERHPISFAIDGSNRWWQSPTIANGRQYNWISIELDLKQIYQVAYVIIKAANAPRPGQWILERSVDGIVYEPWMYFAMTDSDCWNIFHVEPTVGVPRYQTDKQVICTSAYSQLDPLENGEIHLSLVNGRPGVEGPSKELIEFTAARFIRLQLQRIRTLNADLMMAVLDDPKYLDPTVTNRYFYSIKDISVGGQCICYGHARHCPVDPVTRTLQCRCEGNTCGQSCQNCCPKFNQVPWQQGTYTEAFECEECSCFDHADTCAYNASVAEQHLSINMHGLYEGGGVCVDCQHHTMGINCEMCEDGFYRPSGISHNRPDACHICLCDVIGSTGLCIKDDSDEHLGIHAGDCICLEGYCGPRCEECAPGYTGYPHCVPCPCNPAGSLNEDLCEQCICKEHVCSEHCDTCLPGFYNLRADNPQGCDACFCFAITDQCYSSTWGRETIAAVDGWYVTDAAGTGHIEPLRNTDDDSLYFTPDMTTSLDHDVYWSAPQAYKGDKVSSYGGILEYAFIFEVNCTAVELEPDSYLANSDLILEGSGMRLGLGGRYFDEEVEHIVTVNMTEDGWCHMENSTSPAGTGVQREEFLVLLADIDRLLIRATYNIYQSNMKLLRASLDIATETGQGPRMESVEMCSCPEGYAGTSCEICAPGYRRLDNMLVSGKCEPCECNNHADSCDLDTGECLECKHNTKGRKCEICANGYHGNALLGTPDACQPCACPLSVESNSFAESCEDVTGADYPGYTCIMCREGYEGRFCERCSPGYYGNPQQVGSFCQMCSCHGNSIDNNGLALCNDVTGQCLACSGNTEGFNCERCQHGFYGTAVNGDCLECKCNYYGSVNAADCDLITGQCQCRPRFTERDCSQCQAGYYDVAAGCIPCDCGHLPDNRCHPVTGHCLCSPGVGGSKCTQCLPGYYNFSPLGCTACSCHAEGSVSTSCDQTTGQCQCKAGVLGWQCHQCPEDHWGLNVGLGCRQCLCNMTGSYSSTCDADTGSCQCKPQVSGRTCDQCQVGFFGFSAYGCQECDECTKPGHICDPLTGRCVCPPNTEGSACERCRPHSWGYDPVAGCKLCGCSETGSVSSECDAVTSQCQCTGGYRGLRCDQCPYGFYGFPYCSPCNCNPAGTQTKECRNGLCQCEDSGQCLCKDNVEGRQCDTCSYKAFGVVAIDNRIGCTSCFCFGRTDRCRQAPYIWSEVALPSQAVSVIMSSDNSLAPTANSVLLIPDGVSIVHVNPQHSNFPIFWSLSKLITGDRTLSYGGRFKFKLMLDAVNIISSPGPDVVSNSVIHLVGNDRVKLFHVPAHQTNGNHRQKQHALRQFEVILHQDHWVDEFGQPITRQQLMVALQRVQQFLIKVSDHSGHIREARLFDISLEQALPSSDHTVNAYGIELCSCPPHYTGLSCQDPVDGRYRLRPENIVDIVDLVGISERCQCNGRSDVCDRETGHCLNCRENTAGMHCDVCAAGYYSTTDNVVQLNCRLCACPSSHQSNNFSPTCILSSTRDDYICNACQPGYIGNKCERCAPGYYGNPNIPGGSCLACDCNPQGSQSLTCDPVTGQCHCFSGIMGRSCDQCRPRYAVVNGVCQSCDEGCTGVLIATVNESIALIVDFNSSATALLPWARMNKVNATAQRLKNVFNMLKFSDLEALRRETQNLSEVAKRLKLKSEELLSTTETEVEVSTDTLTEAEEIARTVQQQYHIIKDLIDKLLEPVSGSHPITDNVATLLRQAEEWLRSIRAVEFDEHIDSTHLELNLAEDLLSRVKQLAVGSSLNTSHVDISVNDITMKLNDLRNYVNSVQDRLKVARLLNVNNRQLIIRIKNIIHEANSVFTAAKDTCQNATSINEWAAHYLWNVSSANYMVTQELLRTLREKKAQLETFNDQMTNGLEGLPELVKQAADHAAYLHNQASSLDGLFSASRELAENPLKAAQAYEQTATAINDAAEAAHEAMKAADAAYDKMSSTGRDSLTQQAKSALTTSRHLRSNATQLADIVNKDLKPGLDSVVEKLQETEIDIKQIREDLVELGGDLPESTTVIKEEGTRVREDAIETIDALESLTSTVDDINYELNETIIPKMKELVEGEGFIPLRNAVVSATNQADELIYRMNSLYPNASRLRQLGADIGHNILELRRLIEEARAQAASIKVSLYHRGGCVRKYAVPNRTSLANTVVLNFKTNSTNKNMVLFHLANPEGTKFMSLELVDQRVKFMWNIGAGSTPVEHPLEIESINGKSDERDMWYRVVARRIGNLGKLMVQKLSDTEPGTEQTAESYPSHSRLDLNSGMDLFIGGLPNGYRGPMELESETFDGCIGDVEMDGKPIGLFNFQRLVQKQGCRGCVPVPESYTTPQSGIYQFDGTGYVGLPQIKYRQDQFAVIMEFKIISKEALLFYTTNSTTGDFMSIEMRGGNVWFRFGFRNEVEGTLVTANKYNTNTWTRLKAKRIKLDGVLIVGTETVMGTSQPPSDGSDTMDLAQSTLFFAGLPKSIKTHRHNVTRRSFIGCVTSVHVDSRGSILQKLDEGLFVGMKPGCPTNAQLVGLPGTGYIELASPVLLKSNDRITFSFRTHESDGLMLLAKASKQSDPSLKGFYSVSLVNGHVNVWLNSGSGTSVITTSGQYNDGLIHGISVVKSSTQVQVFIDNQLIDTIKLLAEVSSNGVNGDAGQLFVGGVPDANMFQGLAATLLSFKGCIMDLVINGQLLAFDAAVSYNDVDVGRCIASELFDMSAADEGDNDGFISTIVPSFTVVVTHPSSLTTRRPRPTGTTPIPTSCATEGIFSHIQNAVSFGDIRHSNAEIIVRDDYINENFNVTMTLRTYYAKGLLFYITNELQSAYIAIQLVNNTLNVIYKGDSDETKSIHSNAPIGNGLWHNLAVIKENATVKFLVDDRDGLTDSITRRVDVIAPIYVGGVPKFFEPRSDQVITESFKGCIKDFDLNGNPIDIANSKAIMGVRQCFSKSEPGVHLDSYGYAIYAEHFSITNSFNASFAFRTTRETGVILTTSSTMGGLAVEMHYGKLTLTGVAGKGVYNLESRTCEFCLCDNQWHAVEATIVNGRMSLRVDTVTDSVDVSAFDLNHELYIGGFPVFAQNQLATHTGDYFEGCLRNVHINGVLVDWHAIYDLIDIHVSGCPVADDDYRIY